MTVGHMTSKKRRKRTSEMDMDNKVVEKGYTEESGGILGWKSGLLHEPKDQLEKQRKLR